jgi:hypothetical protein
MARLAKREESMSAREPVNFDTVRQLALALPGVEEGTSYGTPAFKVKKKLLARLREDGETLAIMIEFGDREFRLQTNPDVFYVTDHYAGYPMILVRLAKVDPDDLRELVRGAWRMVAPKKLLDQA